MNWGTVIKKHQVRCQVLRYKTKQYSITFWKVTVKTHFLQCIIKLLYKSCLQHTVWSFSLSILCRCCWTLFNLSGKQITLTFMFSTCLLFECRLISRQAAHHLISIKLTSDDMKLGHNRITQQHGEELEARNIHHMHCKPTHFSWYYAILWPWSVVIGILVSWLVGAYSTQ